MPPWAEARRAEVCGHVSEAAVCGEISTYVAGFPALSVVEKHPIEYPILLLAESLENLSKQLPEEVVVGRLLEAQLADIVHVDRKLLWKPRKN